ncbi:acyl-CoA dehydrogenase family protein [Nocardioides halotolerans]|uniref:acyl-CoA dehydrogenase family protein n=1 Tax=Nocardioides halotolerans TaxID=433660 RepID=UPI0003FB3662|nr:acyl-CoA dehydrogenase family protein [Nocardioides halotolerans]
MRFVADERETALREEFRAFFAAHCTEDYVAACDEGERFPAELYRAAGEHGVLATFVPREYGGRGEDAVGLAILFQEAGRAFPDFANLVVRESLCVTALVKYASEEQKQRWLPRFASGALHMAFGASEPGAGSDVGSLATVATPDGDDFRVTGEKLYATGADVADAVLVFARLPGTRKRDGVTALVVPTDAPGLTVDRLSTLGVRATGTAAVHLDGVRVPAADVVGGAGDGWKVLLAGLDLERMATAAIGTGASRLLLERTVEFLKGREQFGQPLGRFQAVRHRVADLAMSIDAAELSTMLVARGMVEGVSVQVDASIAKLTGTETYMTVAHQAVQLQGGRGYTLDKVVQRHFRDAKMYEIGGGASDIQRDIIAKGLGL